MCLFINEFGQRGLFGFIAFECFARRGVIIDDKNYLTARFRGVFSSN